MEQKYYIETTIGIFILVGLLESIKVREIAGKMDFEISNTAGRIYEFPEPVVQAVWSVDNDNNKTYHYQRKEV